MSEQEPGAELVLPTSGEIVDLTSESAISRAYKELKPIKEAVLYADRRLREALREVSVTHGTKTFHIDGVGKVELKGGERTDFPDPLALADALRAAGCPEEVVDEIVVARIEYKVDQRRASRAARANPEYAEIIERHRVKEESLPSISIS